MSHCLRWKRPAATRVQLLHRPPAILRLALRLMPSPAPCMPASARPPAALSPPVPPQSTPSRLASACTCPLLCVSRHLCLSNCAQTFHCSAQHAMRLHPDSTCRHAANWSGALSPAAANVDCAVQQQQSQGSRMKECLVRQLAAIHCLPSRRCSGMRWAAAQRPQGRHRPPSPLRHRHAEPSATSHNPVRATLVHSRHRARVALFAAAACGC